MFLSRSMLLGLWCCFIGVWNEWLAAGQTVKTDCVEGCTCSPQIRTNDQQNWMMLHYQNRYHWMMVGRGKSHQSAITLPHKDEATRWMTCAGIKELPENLPEGIIKLTIYGETIDSGMDKPDGSSLTQLAPTPTGIGEIKRLTIEGNNLEVLDATLFGEMGNMEALSLRNNRIKTVLPYSFSGLVAIETIDLSMNQLTFLSNITSVTLHQLHKLHVHHNAIEEVYPQQFEYMETLEDVDLSHNSINYLDDKAFHMLPNLRKINLANNRLKYVSSLWLERSLKLSWLSLENNNITLVDGGSFSGLGDLSLLNLGHNELTSLDAELFQGLSNLKTLDVRSNRISILYGGAFSSLLSLVYLDLSNNMIQYLEDGTFSGLDSLDELSLRKNSIATLTNTLLLQMPELAVLDLSQNRLDRIPTGLFRNMSSLREIRLDSNEITQVDDRAFSVSTLNNLSKLGWLFLDNNKIRIITSGTLAGTPFLRYVGLSNNRIEHIDSKSLQHCHNLITLDLDSNKISEIPMKLFQRQNQLKRLKLSENSLTSIDIGSLDGLQRLVDLFLNGNFIHAIHPNAFQAIPRIRQINISHNSLDWIDMNIFQHAQYLKYLDISSNNLVEVVPAESDIKVLLKLVNLQNNQIYSLQKAILSTVDAGGKLNLAHNPWLCNCELAWLPEQIHKTPNLFPDMENITCDRPSTFTEIKLINMIPQSLCDGIMREFSRKIPTTKAVAKETLPKTTVAMPVQSTQKPTKPATTTPVLPPFRFNIGTMPIIPKLLCSEVNSQPKLLRGSRLLSSWHTSLVNVSNSDVLCSGARLDENWVVTSASCVYEKINTKELNAYRAIIGSTEVREGKKRNIRTISRIYAHPEYKKRGKTNDVALLLLDTLSRPYRLYSESPCVMSQADLRSTITVFKHGKITASIKNQPQAVTVKVIGNKLSTTFCSNDKYICSRMDGANATTHSLLDAPVYVRNGIRKSDWALAGITTQHTRKTRSGKITIYKHLPLYAYVNWFEHVMDQEARWLARVSS